MYDQGRNTTTAPPHNVERKHGAGRRNIPHHRIPGQHYQSSASMPPWLRAPLPRVSPAVLVRSRGQRQRNQQQQRSQQQRQQLLWQEAEQKQQQWEKTGRQRQRGRVAGRTGGRTEPNARKRRNERKERRERERRVEKRGERGGRTDGRRGEERRGERAAIVSDGQKRNEGVARCQSRRKKEIHRKYTCPSF